MKINSWDKRATTDALGWILAALVAGCGTSRTPVPVVAPGNASLSGQPPVDFSFDSLDERPVNADATRGQPTVLAFVTTASLPAQAQVDFLVAMAGHDGNRVHYAIIAMEGPDSRELVELYRKALAIPFPVAMADDRTLAGHGGFGDVSVVPVTVVLNRLGRLVSRVDGRVAKSTELRAAMRGL